MKKQWIIEFICALFILLFVYAGLEKALDQEKFGVQMQQSPMIAKYAIVLVWVVPITEFIISVFLFLPRLRLYGLYGAFFLMVLFTGYVIAVLNYGGKIPCSCGGVIQNLSWKEHLFFNGGFLFLAIVGLVLSASEKSEKSSIGTQAV